MSCPCMRLTNFMSDTLVVALFLWAIARVAFSNRAERKNELIIYFHTTI